MAVVALFFAMVAHGMNVTILVIEEVNAGRTGPPYDYIATLTDLPANPVLIDVMNFAEHFTNFTYSAIASATCGYYITKINGVTVNSEKYWEILGGQDLSPLNLGGRTSNYYPESGENVLFRLRTWNEYGIKKNVTVTLTEEVNAALQRAHYDNVVHVRHLEANATLTDVLKKAETEGNLKFDAAFSELHVEWYILDGEVMSSTSVGQNCYVPADGENVLLSLPNLKSEEFASGVGSNVYIVVFGLFIFISVVLAAMAIRNRKIKNQYNLTV